MSRKYRQHGYQDSDRDERRGRSKPPPGKKKPLTPEEKAQLRGLRKATDRTAREVVRCPTCGTNVQAFGVIGADTRCPKCGKAIHCCRACMQFDPGARWECRAEITERVSDKLEVNSCEMYEPRLVLDATGKRAGTRSSGDPKSRFEDLFRR
jgi:hypothetical protein